MDEAVNASHWLSYQLTFYVPKGTGWAQLGRHSVSCVSAESAVVFRAENCHLGLSSMEKSTNLSLLHFRFYFRIILVLREKWIFYLPVLFFNKYIYIILIS